MDDTTRHGADGNGDGSSSLGQLCAALDADCQVWVDDLRLSVSDSWWGPGS